MNISTSKVRLAYFEASDRSRDKPRLMMFGSMDVDWQSIQLLFKRLASTPGELLQLDKQPFVIHSGLEVVLVNIENNIKRRRYSLGLQRLVGVARLSFEWAYASDDWGNIADLLDPLIASDAPCHQYLTTYPYEDAIVVVSKGEYTDDGKCIFLEG